MLFESVCTVMIHSIFAKVTAFKQHSKAKNPNRKIDFRTVLFVPLRRSHHPWRQERVTTKMSLSQCHFRSKSTGDAPIELVTIAEVVGTVHRNVVGPK